MAPPRRHRRRTRRVRRRPMMRRRRAFRRRRTSTYDGIVMRKIITSGAIQWKNSFGHADFSINWMGDETTADNNYCKVQDLNEWTQFSALFREYRVMYMSYTVMPIQQSTKTADSNVQSIITCHQMDRLPTATMADATLVGQDTYRERGWRSFSGRVNVNKFQKSRAINWLPTTTTGFNGGTLVRMLCAGYTDTNPLARIRITYYVQFRGTKL